MIIDLDDIKHAVAIHYRIRVEELIGDGRRKTIVEARAAYCGLARKLTRASLKEIGAVLNDRHHTTIINSLSISRRDCVQKEIGEIEHRLRA